MSVMYENVSYFESDDEEITSDVKDPLENLENPKYYRLNETVFAEPIPLIKENAASDGEVNSELQFIDNVMIKKQTGKRNKYLFDVSGNPADFQCPQLNCSKTFNTSILLRTHIRRVHCAERNRFMCEHCGTGFSASYLLQRHMVVHNKERRECSLCGKMLSKRTNMSQHLRRHATARPHACHICHRAFLRRATLNTHVRFVHRTGDLCCSTCGERFPSRKLLMTHKSCRQK